MLAVRGAGYEPEQVVLEITERTDARKEILVPEAARLRALGFKLALDDVGAGNAGLEMLRALPVDFIKIDRAVVASAVEDRGARAVMLGDHGLRARERLVRHRRGHRDRGDAGARARPQPRGEARAIGAQGAQGFLLGRPAPRADEAPSYTSTLATLSVLTAARERRRIAAALQGGDELYRVLLRTVPDMVVALFDRDLRCQVVDGGIDTIDQWRAILEGKHRARGAWRTRATASSWTRLLRPVLDGEATEFEWLGRRSGARLHVQAVPVRDDRAGVIGVMAVCRDITQRARGRRAAALRAAGPTGSPAPSR